MRLGKVEPPQTTYFYKRVNGTIFSCNAAEAHAVHKMYEQVGVSDGTTFFNMMTEEMRRQDELVAKTATSRTPKLLAKLEKETHLMLKKAFDAELEAARGHLQLPPDTRMVIEGGNRDAVASRIAQMGI